MFERRAQEVAQYRAEVAELRKQIEGLTELITNLQNRGSTINRDILAWGDAHKAMKEAYGMVDQMALYAERSGIRLGVLEGNVGLINGTLLQHQKVFRTLGADMMLRATGGGSVAPPAPSEEQKERLKAHRRD